MKILVFGAGKIGSVYAARLLEAGNAVTVIARGQRASDLRENGILLEDCVRGEIRSIPVQVSEKLSNSEEYDLVLVTVRRDQWESVLPSLAANRHIPTILFLGNNTAGFDAVSSVLGSERVIAGFPGVRAIWDGLVLRGVPASRFILTRIGELDGNHSERIQQIASLFRQAGFPVMVCSQIDAWLKTHAALLSPFANALYLAGGDPLRLAATRDGVVLYLRAVREGIRVLQRIGTPVTPAYLRALKYIPEPLLTGALQRGLPILVSAGWPVENINDYRAEMQELALEFRELAVQAGLPTPAVDNLYKYLSPEIPPVPEGKADLQLDWTSLWAGFGLVAAGAITAGYIVNHYRRKE